LNLTTVKQFSLIILALLVTSLSSCASHTENSLDSAADTRIEERDASCSYFYFLWGTHEEYNQRFKEALDAYQKALICDPAGDYIKMKLPILYLKMEEVDEAVVILTEALQESPRDTAQRALLARIYIQQKQEDKAIEQYNEILSYEPENEQALLRLGILLSQKGELAQSSHYFQKLIALNQEAYFARLYLARIADRLEKPEEASQQYFKALELNWSADLIYEIAEFHLKREQYEDAVTLLRSLLEKDPTDERARFTLVQALLATGREEEAIAELSLAREKSTSPEQISLILSKLYLRNKNVLKAEQNLLAILEFGDNAEARYLLAALYLDENRNDEALIVLDGIRHEQEQFEDAVILKSRIYHQNNQTAEALEMLQGYIDNKESRRPLFYILASSLLAEEDRNGEAIELLENGLEHFPDNERLLFEYGLRLEQTGRIDDAITVMVKILEINPDHAEALNFVGYSWADLDMNLEKAYEYINRAMELKPDNGYIQDSLGWVYFKLGNLEQAENELLKALSLVPDDPHIHEHLGDVYRALGKSEEARAAYEAAFNNFQDETKKNRVRRKIEELQP